MSGHSKWAQIKHKKALTDAKRGQLFSKMVREIMIAARSGGALIETNSRLKTAIERAKTSGLPKENIERAIERASGSGDAASLQEFIYEAMAPGGVFIIVEGITDNKNRSLAEIKHTLSESGGKLAEQGSLLWNFEKIGLINVSRTDNADKTDGEIELQIIESGAEDLQKINGGWIIETGFLELEKIRKELENKKIKIMDSYHDYKARAPVSVSPEEKNTVETIIKKLSEHDDVQEVYTNLTND